MPRQPYFASPAMREPRSLKAARPLRLPASKPTRRSCEGAKAGSPRPRCPSSPENLDLAVSILSLQEANDIPGMLIQIRRALRPDGLFLGAMAGSGTLAELRESLLAAESELYGGASPRVIPFADVRDVGALLQRAGFALPVADVEAITVRYDDMFALMRDLRAMGVTNALAARSRRPATRELFVRAARTYAERFSDPDGRIRATFRSSGCRAGRLLNSAEAAEARIGEGITGRLLQQEILLPKRHLH